MVVGRAVLAVLADSVTAVGGMTMGADPIAVAVALEAAHVGRSLRAFSVRKEAKGHGVGGRLVGPLRGDDRVAVVEDATTTGGALMEAVGVLTDTGHQVVQAVALVDRSGGVVAARMLEQGTPYRALVTAADLGVS